MPPETVGAARRAGPAGSRCHAAFRGAAAIAGFPPAVESPLTPSPVTPRRASTHASNGAPRAVMLSARSKPLTVAPSRAPLPRAASSRRTSRVATEGSERPAVERRDVDAVDLGQQFRTRPRRVRRASRSCSWRHDDGDHAGADRRTELYRQRSARNPVCVHGTSRRQIGKSQRAVGSQGGNGSMIGSARMCPRWIGCFESLRTV